MKDEQITAAFEEARRLLSVLAGTRSLSGRRVA